MEDFTRSSVSDIRLIKFEDFEAFGGFPRFPDNQNLCHRIDSIDRDNSLLIFVSHCWLTPNWRSSWCGKAHPDNPEGVKFALCVHGIKRIKTKYAPRMKNCYLWIDYSCINQNDKKLLKDDLERYDDVMRCCDAMFTPIYDPHHTDWVISAEYKDFMKDYKAPAWGEGPSAYLNRGWCRVEMFYAANIPVMPNASSTVQRHTMFEAALSRHCLKNKRPHFLYGSKEDATGEPRLLPPLQNSYLESYHPRDGFLSVEEDRKFITMLMKELQPYIDQNTSIVGYTGDVNENGEPHGKGTRVDAAGDVYTGEWKNGKRHGQGSMLYSELDEYVGGWKNDERSGLGTFYYPTGNVFTGQFIHGLIAHGRKINTLDGTYCEGGWLNATKHGSGEFAYMSDVVYEGDMLNGMKHGHGKLTAARRTDIYEGEFFQDKRHGHGVVTDIHGNTYEGEWRNDKKHGRGRLIKKATGEVIEVEWDDDRLIY